MVVQSEESAFHPFLHSRPLVGKGGEEPDQDEQTLREQLQAAFDEQAIMALQFQELLTEVDRLYREQAQAAITDVVTGLPNHRAIISRLDEEIARCQRRHIPCSLLFIDLDHFKRINDRWGHLIGDAVLREMGQRLRSALRQKDFIGRFGGEEFVVILSNTYIHKAGPAAHRLCKSIVSGPYIQQAEDGSLLNISVTASIGVAVYGIHGRTPESLLRSADMAMYQAKLDGRNCVRVADEEFPAALLVKMHDADSASTGGLTSNNKEQLRQIIPVQVIQALAAMAAAHDQGTSDHSQRMMWVAEETGRMLGVPEEEEHLVALGALLHDIGKVGIPDAILHKPGPLTLEEWIVMRRHPEIGRKVLEELGGVFQHLAPIVAAHHEHWDGTGYPAGLAGEDIPFASRILSVVDAYDAMISRRSYKEPMPSAAARNELRCCANQQFDPVVVEAFLKVIGAQSERADSPQGSAAIPV